MNELIKNLSFPDYRALDGLSISALKEMRTSPMKYQYSLTAPRFETPAMALGTAAHLAILEPHRMGTEFAPIYPGAVRRGKEWEAHQALHAGKLMLNQTELDAVIGMRESVLLYAPAMELLETGDAEVSMLWTDAETGLPCRGRMDWLTMDGEDTDIIVDLKTTKSVNAQAFGKQAHSLGYHLQAAYYCDGFFTATGRYPQFKFLCVESSAPHEVALFSVPAEVIAQGRMEYRQLLARLVECEASGVWPPALTEEIPLQLPRWAMTPEAEDFMYQEF